MPFYFYHQNNSGGSWSGPAINVIIEADSTDHADEIFLTKGGYFDSASEDDPESRDCPCCGARWYPNYGEESPVPSIYGKPIVEGMKEDANWMGLYKDKDVPYAIVFYADGREEKHELP